MTVLSVSARATQHIAGRRAAVVCEGRPATMIFSRAGRPTRRKRTGRTPKKKNPSEKMNKLLKRKTREQKKKMYKKCDTYR